MKRFIINAIDQKLLEAVIRAEALLDPKSALMMAVKQKNDWKYNAGTGDAVYQRLISQASLVPVFVVAPKRKTSAVGYFQNGKIFIYTTYLETATVEELVATLLHEWAHHQGFNHSSAFGTSNFKTKHKCLYSVPYWLSENAKNYL